VDETTAAKVSRTIRRSIEYASARPEASVSFIRENARETDPEVMKEHINLYVNNFSMSLGQEGRSAIERLYSVAVEKGVLEPLPERIFLL
jgi:1,4-dihydroxy-6-naphthoate synthase